MWLTLLLLFGVFFGLVFMRVPVAIALAFSALVGMLITGLSLSNVVTQLYRGLDVFTILAIPFFLAAGFLAAATSVSQRLLDLASLLIGRIRGGLGHANVAGSMLFAGVSGSSTADTAGLGAVLVPMMRKRGYSPEYAAALTGVSSVIGNVIPPSIFMIIYGAFAGASIGALFLAGFVPGIAVGLALMGINYSYARRHDIDRSPPRAIDVDPAGSDAATTAPAPADRLADGESTDAGSSAASTDAESPTGTSGPTTDADLLGRSRSVIGTVWGAIPSLFIPVLILGGITTGVFTATEAGMVALLYILALTVLVYRELRPRRVLEILNEAVLFYSLPVLAAGAATTLGIVLGHLGVSVWLRELVAELDVPSVVFLVIVATVFFVIGTFLDGFPAIVLFAPLFVAPAVAAGVHPVHLGLVVVMTLGLGLVTPPYGICLLVAAKIAEVSASRVIRSMLPMWALVVAIIVLVILLPDVVLWLPRTLLPEAM